MRMGKVRRVIYRNGEEFGEIEVDPYGKKIVRNVYGEDVGEIEEDVAGNESIVKYDKDKKHDFGKIEFDPYKNREVIRRNDEEEDEEIEYEPVEDDSDFNPLSLLAMVVIGAAKGFYDGWRKASHKNEYKKERKYQLKQPKEQINDEKMPLGDVEFPQSRRIETPNKSQYELERIASDRWSHVDKRVAAVKNMANQYELENIANGRWNHVDLRVAAVKNMTNQSELERIASDRYIHVDLREAASKRLKSLKR
jgi:hypothetical protein